MADWNSISISKNKKRNRGFSPADSLAELESFRESGAGRCSVGADLRASRDRPARPGVAGASVEP